MELYTAITDSKAFDVVAKALPDETTILVRQQRRLWT